MGVILSRIQASFIRRRRFLALAHDFSEYFNLYPSGTSDIDSGNKEFEKIMLKQLVSELKPKEQQLITMRYFKGATQMKVADMLGISQVQVSRMEKRILDDMRTKMAE